MGKILIEKNSASDFLFGKHPTLGLLLFYWVEQVGLIEEFSAFVPWFQGRENGGPPGKYTLWDFLVHLQF